MKFLVGAVVALMALVLVACPSPQASPTPDETEVAQTEEPEETGEPEETEEAEETDEPQETDEPEETDDTTAGEGCPADLIESDDADAVEHVDAGETVEYDTNPPAAGPHSGTPAEVGTIYGPIEDSGYTVENFVHNMEHGAVIFWTNNLSEEERELAEDAVNDIYGQGYEHLIMLEYNDMEVPFAMTAWGYLQECEAVDDLTAELMQLFTDEFYGSGIEGFAACRGEAAELPGCEKWAE